MALRIPYMQRAARPRGSSFSADIGRGGVDYSPLSNAVSNAIELFFDQRQTDRESKHKTAVVGAAQDVRRLAFGINDPNDPNYVADPAARPDAFLKGKAAIRDRYLKTLNDQGIGGLDSFDAQFEQSSLSEEFDVRRAATVALRDKQEGELDATLFESEQLAGEGSPEQTAQWREFGLSAIDTAEAGGVISAVDAEKRRQKYLSGIIETRVRRDIMADPHAAEQALLSGDYQDLDPDKRISFLERAGGRAERKERQQQAAWDRAVRLQEKAERDNAQGLARAMYALEAKGELTAEWVDANADDMDPSDVKWGYDKLKPEATATKTDPGTYARLRELASLGEADPEDLKDALLSNHLALGDYERLSQMNVGFRPEWVQRGEEILKARFPASDQYDAEVSIRRAAVMDAWAKWSDAHPDATPEEANKAREGIATSFSEEEFENSTAGLALPRNAVGGRYDLDVTGTMDALRAEFMIKHFGNEQAVMDDPEFREQATLILQWQKAMRGLKQQKAPANG